MTTIRRVMPNPDLRRQVNDILDAEAAAAGHPFNVDHMMVEARDGRRFLGALTARMSMDFVYVELLAIVPAARGKGIGKAILQEAEDWALERGAVAVYLDTYGFQAPDFYPRLGYEPMGTLVSDDPTRSRHFFQKRLAQP